MAANLGSNSEITSSSPMQFEDTGLYYQSNHPVRKALKIVEGYGGDEEV